LHHHHVIPQTLEHWRTMNTDMYDYINVLNQPPPKPSPAAPAPAKPKEKSKAELRYEAAKEKAELREWWANLDESKKQKIRDTKYWLEPPKEKKPPKKKPEPKPKPKPAPKVEQPAQYAPFCGRDLIIRPIGKPDWVGFDAIQQMAIAQM